MVNNKVNIYKMNECVEFWAGESLEECILNVEDFYGDMEDAVESPRILTEEEMDTLIFLDIDGEFGEVGNKYTFREALEKCLENGEKTPFMFATEDY